VFKFYLNVPSAADSKRTMNSNALKQIVIYMHKKWSSVTGEEIVEFIILVAGADKE
jgi:hypothetical protein